MKNILIILLISFTSLSMAKYVAVILNSGDITFKNLEPSDNYGTGKIFKIMASDRSTGDSFGSSVSISGNTVIIGADVANAAYVFKNTGSEWVEIDKLTASESASFDNFGFSVSVSGDVAIIGAKKSNGGTGSAYIFKDTGSEWVEVDKIMASDGTSYDYFGSSVAISGDVAIVGSYGDDDRKGAAYVFKNTGSEWVEVSKLTPSVRSNLDKFGYSVSMSGDVAIIGAYGADDRKGAAYVFKNTGSEWVEVSKLTPSDDLAAQFGNSIVISGDVAIIGANGSNGETGAAYVFKNTGSEWVEVDKLTASDGTSYDYFGSSIAISGDTAIIGTSGGANVVYVFKNTGSEWVEVDKLTANIGTDDSFGSSVAINGDTVMVGASDEDGSVYIFKDTGSEWVEVDKLKLKDGDYKYYYAARVAMSGNTAIVTAPGYFDYENGENVDSKGAAYVYKNNGEKWIETAQIKANDGKSFDLFGSSVAISGNTVILGAMGVVVVENENSTGAAYIFEPE